MPTLNDLVRLATSRPILDANQVRRSESPNLNTQVDGPAVLDSNIWAWSPQPKQELALARTEREVYYGGTRFGGKTYCQIMWLGRLAIERLNGVLRYPNYKGLVVRRQYDDLKDWISEAKIIYSKLGGKDVGRPVEFRFPGGPIIGTGHLDGEEGFQKYQGAQKHKLAIDEVNQIESEDTYLPMQASVRVSPDGYSQTFCTGNPGGAGDAWVKRRWIRVYSNGVLIPPGTPFRDPETGKTRIFIQAYMKDNQRGIDKDPEYISSLLDQKGVRKQQWVDGNWDAVESAFFYDFRRTPGQLEPEHAYHVCHSSEVELLPYYRRWISMDWGYNDLCCVYWHCQHDDGRIYTYREMVCRKTGAFEIGKRIAQITYKELEKLPDQTIELFLSPDAFSKKNDTNTIDMEIKRGMESVLGFGTAVSLSMTEDEIRIAETDPKQAQNLFLSRIIELVAKAGITIRPANNNRAAGLSFIQQLLAWTTESALPSTQELMKRLTKLSSREAVTMVAKWEAQRKSEATLPKWRTFSDKCPLLIETIPACQMNPNKPDDHREFPGDDPIDAWRYGMIAWRDMPAEMPKEYMIQRMIDKYKEGNPNVDINVMRMMWVRANSKDQQVKVTQMTSDLTGGLLLAADHDTGGANFSDPFGSLSAFNGTVENLGDLVADMDYW